MATPPSSRDGTGPRGLPRWTWLLPALLALAAYAPAPWADFAWDDRVVVGQQLPAFAAWRDAFFPPAGLEQWSAAYYRPVVVLSYMLDRALFAGGPAGPHVVNVALHVAVTLAVLALLRTLLPGRDAAALAGASLFAVHPIHTESVSWMSGRSDVLAALFLVPAVLLALRWRDERSGAALALCAAALLLAMLAKEVALAAWFIVPAALLLTPAAGARTRPRVAMGGAALALLLATAGWLALRQAALAGTMAGTMAGSVAGPPAWTAADAGLAARVAAFLAIKSVWPWPQLHVVPAALLPGPAATAGALAALAALAAAAFAAWRRRGAGLPLLALCWFVAACAPAVAAALLGVAETPVAERYLYVPSVAVVIAAALLVAAATDRGHARAVGVAAALLAAAWAAATVQRGLVWQDEEALWRDAVAKSPGEALPLNALGRARDARGDLDGALALWLQARELARDPQLLATIEGNIGIAYLRRGQLPAARERLEAAVRADGGQHNTRRALGAVLFTQAMALPRTAAAAPQARTLLDAARGHYEAALVASPRSTAARLELALVLAQLGDLAARYGGPSSVDLHAQALARLEEEFATNPAARDVPAVRQLAERLAAAVARGGGPAL